jgi:hypothetical protein
MQISYAWGRYYELIKNFFDKKLPPYTLVSRPIFTQAETIPIPGIIPLDHAAIQGVSKNFLYKIITLGPCRTVTWPDGERLSELDEGWPQLRQSFSELHCILALKTLVVENLTPGADFLN